MLKIGITGGIGSGKSIVCNIFRQLAVPVYDSDREAKLLMADPLILQQVKKIFGENVFDERGKLDNKKLAEIVFKNKEHLDKLNAIVHPVVREHFVEWLKKHSNSAYILNESAIVFEHDLHKKLDAVIVVLAPENIRISRVMKRDGVSEKDVLQRMKNQITDEERKQKANYFIINDESVSVIQQVLKINALLTVRSQKAEVGSSNF